MTLKLYFHPLASFCWKVLIALYENDTQFEPIIVDLGDERSRADFKAVWPMAKMPVLRDETRGQTIAESTIIIEYLDRFYAGKTRLLPADADLLWQARMWDRFYDHYVHEPMQRIVADRLRPPGKDDPFGVEQAKAQLRKAYEIIEHEPDWNIDTFSLVDSAAAPALFYANLVVPFTDSEKSISAYLDRLMARPSFLRVLEEAEPYFGFFPMDTKPQFRRPRGKRDGGL